MKPVAYVQPMAASQSVSGSDARFHKQIEWNRIKAFLNEASQEGLDPSGTNKTAASGMVDSSTKLPAGWSLMQLQQLGRYEATVYGKVYLLQLHGPDTPDKRLYRLEKTLQLNSNRLKSLPNVDFALVETRLTALKTKMDAMGIAISEGDQQKSKRLGHCPYGGKCLADPRLLLASLAKTKEELAETAKEKSEK